MADVAQVERILASGKKTICAGCGATNIPMQETMICKSCSESMNENMIQWNNNAESKCSEEKLILILTIPGVPQAKARHRSTRGGSTYNPQSEVERGIQWEIKRQLQPGFEPVKKPLRLDMVAFFPRPRSHYGSGRNCAKLKPSAPFYHAFKPDEDNIKKLYKDCMNKLVYHDDCQVFDGRCRKRYVDQDQPGHVRITLYEP